MLPWLILTTAGAQEVSGFAELRAGVLLGVEGEKFQITERVRPTFDAPLGERIAVVATVEATLSQGRRTQSELQRTLEASALGPLLEAADCTWPEEANARLGISRAADYLSVDRLYVDAYLPAFDLRVGRQALQWGSALFINPTDPFPEVLFTEPWRPRAGVNAARLTVPLANRHQVQAVVGSDDLFQRLRLAARGTVNALETDFSLVSAYREEAAEVLTGLDIRGTLGVGFWVEAALHARGVTDAAVRDDIYEEVAIGVDHSFPVLERLVVVGQYLRSGADVPAGAALAGLAGALEPPTCRLAPPDAFPTGPTDPFAAPFSGENYGLLSASLGMTTDLSGAVAWLQNLDDGTAMIVPTVTGRPGGAVEVAAAAQVPAAVWGNGGELKPRAQDMRVALPVAPGTDPVTVDLSGLAPDVSLYAWARVGF